MNWDKNNGLYQIMGENAVGKTNLLSGILYLLHGKTLETLKRETNGDDRFINNKRDLDYCQAGAIINVDETRFSLTRRTERKWDRTKTKITSCPTTLKINLIDSNGEIINQTDEEKAKNQEYLSNIIGSFDDFLALYLVNADTLNNLLSMDESVFMDTILKYSGLDIFERKLSEYKDYKDLGLAVGISIRHPIVRRFFGELTVNYVRYFSSFDKNLLMPGYRIGFRF